MLQLNVKRLMEAISEAETYSLDNVSNLGVKYLCERFYKPLANGMRLKLSDIDFTEFELEDVGDFGDYYNTMLSAQNSAADNIRSELSKIPPKASKSSFI